jgi:hypothetical protein
LSALCLGGNRLVEVPESMGRLRGLEVLVLSDNHLESLPPTIASLDRLKTLQLHNNRLRTLPTQIITLSCLSQVTRILFRSMVLKIHAFVKRYVVKWINDHCCRPQL